MYLSLSVHSAISSNSLSHSDIPKILDRSICFSVFNKLLHIHKLYSIYSCILLLHSSTNVCKFRWKICGRRIHTLQGADNDRRFDEVNSNSITDDTIDATEMQRSDLLKVNSEQEFNTTIFINHHGTPRIKLIPFLVLFPFFDLWIFYCRYNIRILSSKHGLYFLEKSIFLEISFLPLFLFPSNRKRNKLNLLNSTPWISRKFLWIALPAFFLAGESFSACVTPSVGVGNSIHIHIILLIQRNVKRKRSFVKVTIIFADRGCREVIYSTCSLRKFSSFVFYAFKYLLGMLIKYTKINT